MYISVAPTRRISMKFDIGDFNEKPDTKIKIYSGRAMVQAVSRRPLTTEARFRFQVKSM
jgi:hypothetical protein